MPIRNYLTTYMRVRSLGLVAFLAMFCTAIAEPSWPQSDEISIAVAGPMTGELAIYGEQLRQGAQSAVNDINAAGGLLGKQVKLEVLDDRCEPETAVKLAQELLDRGVVFVDGHFCSSASIAAMDVYGERSVLMITPSTSSPTLTDRAADKGFKTIFRTVPRYDSGGAVAGSWMADKYAGKRLALLSDETAYGMTLANETQSILEAAKLNATIRETYSEKQTDFSGLISKLKETNIDVVYAGGYATPIAHFVKQARDQGLKVEVVASDDLVSEDFWKIAGPAGEGVQFVRSDPATDLPSAKAVIEKLRTKDFEPEGFTLNSYAAVQAWAAAVNKAGTTDGPSVAEVLKSFTLSTVLGDLTWDPKGDLVNPSYAVYRWSDGRPILAAKLRCPPHCGRETPTPKSKPVLKPTK